ncbi:BRD4-interacting chromatin-remodeling complex-associated protein isoform X1 [Cydia fagiglandana]|uniref:BRD4-interacting chromatin-remodeling complex-associated protein isoform X1 n=1 Tax=Cydia fagiglandana TaxID=1458189 RepID=UPI002FEE5EDC
MSNNLENERTITAGKMYPIDLAPQKITIVKSVSNSEVKMTHLITSQPKTTGAGQIITHAGSMGLIRPASQILTPGVGSQQQMIVSGSPILQGTSIVSQGSQLLGQSSQIITPQLLSGQILQPATQIISQGTQLSVQVSSSSPSVQVSVASPVSGTQVLNVGSLGGQLVTGTGNLVVSSSVRTLPQSVRVLPPLPHHNTRPVLTSGAPHSGGVLVSKAVSAHAPVSKAPASHVPRGLAAGASLALRPAQPAQGWSGGRARGALVYNARAPAPPATSPQHSAIVTLPNTTVLASSLSSGVIAGAVRAPAARPLPLLTRNYQPAKVVGVGVGNSAPPQLYYEVPRAPPPQPRLQPLAPPQPQAQPPPQSHAQPPPQPQPQPLVTSVSVVNAVQALTEIRGAALPAAPAQPPGAPRPSILRKRDAEGSPTKQAAMYGRTGWEDVPAGAGAGAGSGSGSTTMSASSSPAPDTPPDPHPDLEPRKKPRKQMLTNDVRQCEFPPEDAPPTPPPVEVKPPPKRPLLSSSYVCGWRATALHFARPGDVRRREPRARDILAIASQRHVLGTAEGWKVHHLTAQMDDLVSLEADVGSQLAGVLRALEALPNRATAALQPHSHTLLELLKGNIQRSKIVCEGIQEAREDILRVFTHRNFVSDILTRQADKRSFRKHRSQS